MFDIYTDLMGIPPNCKHTAIRPNGMEFACKIIKASAFCNQNPLRGAF
jgi:hypothetical protein